MISAGEPSHGASDKWTGFKLARLKEERVDRFSPRFLEATRVDGLRDVLNDLFLGPVWMVLSSFQGSIHQVSDSAFG